MKYAGHKSRLRNLSGRLEALEKSVELWMKSSVCTIKEQGAMRAWGTQAAEATGTARALPLHPELLLLFLKSDIYNTKITPENPRVKRKGT